MKNGDPISPRRVRLPTSPRHSPARPSQASSPVTPSRIALPASPNSPTGRPSSRDRTAATVEDNFFFHLGAERGTTQGSTFGPPLPASARAGAWRSSTVRAAMMAPPSAIAIKPPSFQRSKSMPDAANFLLLQQARQAMTGQTRFVTANSGDRFTDECDDEVGYKTSKGNVVEVVSLDLLQGSRSACESDRLDNILRAIAEGKPLPPVRVDRHNNILNGFHRVAVSRMLGLTEIAVEKPE